MLALWSFFWNTADWVVAPPPVVVETPAERRGGGGHRREYERTGPDFWLVRDRYLRQVLEPELRKVAIPDAVVEQAASSTSDGVNKHVVEAAAILRERNATLANARFSRNVDELRIAAAKTLAFTLALQAQLEQHYASAVFLLLLDPF